MNFLSCIFPSMSTITSSGYWNSWGSASDYWSDSYYSPGFFDADLYWPVRNFPICLQPRASAPAQIFGQSRFKENIDTFHVMLNVSHFSPDEIEVKVKNNYLVIHCKHDEKADDSGFIQREFTKRYEIPEAIDSNTLKCTLSSDGILLVEAPEEVTKDLPSDEHIIPTAKQTPVEEVTKDLPSDGHIIPTAKQTPVEEVTKDLPSDEHIIPTDKQTPVEEETKASLGE